MSLEKDETTPESGTQDGVSTLSVLLTLSFCAGRQDLALPLASFWLRLCRAVVYWD